MPVPSPSILIVEDDAFMASLLTFLLERQQMRVQHVADGRAALALLEGEAAFDAVVLDLMLPQLSGLDLLGQMRGRAAWSAMPVLVLSAVDAGAEIARAFEAGADDYMGKPFNPEEFLARLRRLLAPRARGGARVV